MNRQTYFDDELSLWVVSDPAEVREVLLDPQTFRPDNALTAFTPIRTQGLRTLSSVGFALPPTLANNASQSHRTIRQTVARYFSPSRVAEAERRTRDLSVDRFERAAKLLADGHTVDLVGGVVGEVPALVLFNLLGLAEVDLPRLRQWSIDSLELFWGRPDAARQEHLAVSAAEFYAWLRTVTQSSRDGLGSPFFSDLVGLGLSDEEICAIGYFLLIAGQETTSQLISTILFRALTDPVVWHAATVDPTVAASTVEQALSDDSSVPTWRRNTLRPARIGNVLIPAGSQILLRLSGVGDSADLAFGIGIHRCLGARLARMEAQVALAVAAEVLPPLELIESKPPMIDLLSFRAPARVLVRAV